MFFVEEVEYSDGMAETMSIVTKIKGNEERMLLWHTYHQN